ncbi:MAG: 3-dehydroquinate synthase [Clostridia bacterium]|nr:3-dehydroquinate synthase [Clostridia bacterium]MBQ7048317.1 3-dehydroquinate synthase [Clostridia bacterium]
MVLSVKLPHAAYDITIEGGALNRAGELFDLDRRCLVVTDDGVPSIYAETVAKQCANAVTAVIPQGEGSKSLATFEKLSELMLKSGFSRKDCVVAVGGGVVGDICGFVASAYMRGVDFYNIPTTLLSQVDSSVGGKTGINFCGVKNIVGAFHQPKGVLIDTNTLKTLPKRHIAAGMAEALKMGLTSDKKLYELFKSGKAAEDMEKLIELALRIKISVVQQDEKEKGLRRVLNFGHSLGHGIEALQGENGLCHGECVALGMLPMCGKKLRAELVEIYKDLGLPTEINVDLDEALAVAEHDKKADSDSINVIKVETAGEFAEEKQSFTEWKKLIKKAMEEDV